jgi:uncharacterized protein (TIGR02453 family)
MNLKQTLEFLSDLKANNNRDWFQQNKKRYDAAKASMLSLLERLIPEIAKFDPTVAHISPKDCIFRIYRDVRFSNDKLPYKTNIGAFVSKTGRKGNHPGYYIHFEPEQSFLAGGLYMPPPELLKAVRNDILFNADEFKSIINHPDFLKYFSQLDDFDKLSRPPKGFATGWPDVELVKYRSYVVTHNLNEQNLLSEEPDAIILSVFRAMLGLNHFLHNAKQNSLPFN